MNERELDAIDEFVRDYDFLVKQLERLTEYIQLGKEGDELKEEAMTILKKKAKKMKKAESVDELKKHLRVKKVIEKKGL